MLSVRFASESINSGQQEYAENTGTKFRNNCQMHREGREDSSKYNLNLSLKISSGKFPKKGWNATSDHIYLYLQQVNAAQNKAS